MDHADIPVSTQPRPASRRLRRAAVVGPAALALTLAGLSSSAWGSTSTATPTGMAVAAAGCSTQSATPLVTGIRVGRHATYDRLVVDLTRPVAGHSVRWLSALHEDGSGRLVTLNGAAKLQLQLNGAAAHTDTGSSTLSVRGGTPSYPELRQWRVIGDFEGVVTVGIGATAVRHVHVFTLTAPNRLVVDIAH